MSATKELAIRRWDAKLKRWIELGIIKFKEPVEIESIEIAKDA